VTDRRTTATQQPLTAVIVGSRCGLFPSRSQAGEDTGFGGIGMAIKLRQAGITDFVMLEKSNQIGGTWRDNTYPGAVCDVPSPLCSFSFEQDFDWPRFYSGQHSPLPAALRHQVQADAARSPEHEVRRTAFDERRGLLGDRNRRQNCQ